MRKQACVKMPCSLFLLLSSFFSLHFICASNTRKKRKKKKGERDSRAARGGTMACGGHCKTLYSVPAMAPPARHARAARTHMTAAEKQKWGLHTRVCPNVQIGAWNLDSDDLGTQTWTCQNLKIFPPFFFFLLFRGVITPLSPNLGPCRLATGAPRAAYCAVQPSSSFFALPFSLSASFPSFSFFFFCFLFRARRCGYGSGCCCCWRRPPCAACSPPRSLTASPPPAAPPPPRAAPPLPATAPSAVPPLPGHAPAPAARPAPRARAWRGRRRPILPH